MNFDALQWVTSGLTLVAFIVMVIFYAYRSQLNHKVKLLETTPDDKKAEVAGRILDDLKIPTESLSGKAQEGLAREELRYRAKRTELYVKYGFWAFIALLTVAVFAIFSQDTSPDDSEDLSLRIGENIEFRHWLEFVGSNGENLERSERLKGPAGLLLVPEFSVLSGMPKNFSSAEIDVELSGNAEEFIRFSPVIIAGIGFANENGTFWNQQGDFAGVKASVGDPWVKQVGARAQSQLSHEEMIMHIENELFRKGRLTITLSTGSEALSASCEFDLLRARDFIAKHGPDDGTAPNVVHTKCEEV